jgi:hypothetical protein
LGGVSAVMVREKHDEDDKINEYTSISTEEVGRSRDAITTIPSHSRTGVSGPDVNSTSAMGLAERNA